VTQIERANYASKGVYFQAFTSLATGFERIGKLCLIVDYYIDHAGRFPNYRYLKHEICHDLNKLYEKSTAIISVRSISMSFLKTLDDPIHKAIRSVLCGFAKGDRYSNIDLLGGQRQNDSIDAWFKTVDRRLYDRHVSKKKKESIKGNAILLHSMLSGYVSVLHTAETGEEVTDVQTASSMAGMWRAIAPYRRLYVLQAIRYWAELLSSLQDTAMKIGNEDIPFFSEIFRIFYNDDSYFKTRKKWETVR
jgi:hypothetical protein